MSVIDLLSRYAREEISLAAPLVLWLINRVYRDRPQLNQSIRHSFTYLIDTPLLDNEGNVLQPRQIVNVASVSILNSGREAATKLEVVFNWEPPFVNIWPARYHDKKIFRRWQMLIFP